MENKFFIGFVFFLLISFVSSFPTDYISHWKFNGNFNDETGSYNGVATDTSIVFDLNRGQVADFDGTGDYVNIGDISELNSVSEFTIMGWVKQNNNVANERIFDKIKDGNNDISIAPFGGKIYFELGNGANSYGYWNSYSSVISSGEWYYLTAVYNGNGATNSDKIKIYVNGVERGLIFSGVMPSTTANLSGYDLTFSRVGDDFNGSLDEVLFYNRSLDKSEIKEIYSEQEKPDKLKEIHIETCMGEGELYLYQQIPFQSLDASFTVQREKLYIFTRADYLSSLYVKVNGVLVSKTLVVDKIGPFKVKVYEVNTSPGDLITIYNSATFDSRAVQGYIAQDSANPAFDFNNLNIVYDDFSFNLLFLNPGTYSYVIFDKYSENNSKSDDSRRLSVKLNNSLTIFDRDYFKPFPASIEGVVKDDYTITTQGNYEFSIDTEDSVYWFLLNCTLPCIDLDKDCICDDADKCLDSKLYEPVDKDGCDPFQFCGQFYCGPSCVEADFIPVLQNCSEIKSKPEKYPHDCTTVIIPKEGSYFPKCVPLTCAD